MNRLFLILPLLWSALPSPSQAQTTADGSPQFDRPLVNGLLAKGAQALKVDPMNQMAGFRGDPGNRGPLFIWNNPPGCRAPGTNAGFQAWIGENPTETPGPCDTVGGTVVVVNGNNRGALWGMNIFTQACNGCGPGYVDAKTTGIEIEAGTGFVGTPLDPWGGGPRKDGIELTAQSGSADKLTSAVMVYANDKTGKGWWNTGFALSRVYDVGILAKSNPTDNDDVRAFQTAVLYDLSDSRTTIKVGPGFHHSVIDMSNAVNPGYLVFGRQDRDSQYTLGNESNYSFTLGINSGHGVSKESNLDFSNNGDLVWRTGKGTDSSYRIYDSALGATPLVVTQGTNTVTMQNVVAANTLRIPFGTVASSSAPCTPGQMKQDATYLYSCAATNSWRRVALGTAW